MQQLKLSNCKVNSLNFSRTKIVPPSPSLIHRGNSKLLNPLHVKLLPSSLCLKLKQLPVINKNLLLLQKGGAGKITKGAKKLKLEKGILLDNYVQRGPRLVDAQSRSLLIHSKRSKRHMSLKQHKKCGSFHLHDTFHRFDLYKPMHEMWKEYMRELTKSTPKKQLAESLLSSDLHGALLIVAQCKAALYEGVSGIMICDTAETFGIISEDNHFRVVPKAGSVFVLQADCWKVTLMGDKLSPKETLKENQRQQRAQSLIR
ncbi:ribonuclease P protein subunit p29 isoform X3 [Brachypodium distachyon]|uniref:ribonuclease P protein subunit p29 isoform X3 n=1 Tax=Brachypodium distachyon TaxID=15368 RepID=UPI0006E487B4|nr:ribonuclease P protein subunit p29 isoform X3 [Brachypodium distachyon]|eukprot:XP_024311144.1 ribonuclease P protein subunit p29 isoform X3 [Brachypodium distachyon]